MATNNFPIVGIGASAGGLQALEVFLRGMPVDLGLAFVVVTHLPRDRESFLPEILGRFTALPVDVAQDGMPIGLNHLYVCPPDRILTIAAGHIRLHQRVDHAERKPIDIFLSSLAEDRREQAIGVILSGSGSDGALGLKAIKERGGLTIAQGHDGTSPQQSNMPDSAVASGVVDLVLSVDAMAARLCEYARELARQENEFAESTHSIDEYQPIYPILFSRVGHDFSGYKEKTFMRRVRRRMQVLQSPTVAQYIKQLSENPDEVTLLFRDLLIGVTSFFRDPDAFHALTEMVMPRLFEGKRASDVIRVWVPGCATGEEVYSIAIVLREYMETAKSSPRVQIFATDIDEAALSIARGAHYPGPLLKNVSTTRLKRFFSGDEASYVVNKDVRDMCIFSSHSVVRDPPFSRMDLVSCRNLLIYLGSNFQAQVIPVFHFALRPRGYLFLGTSENVSQHVDLFSPLDKRNRIFQRRDNVHVPMTLPFFGLRDRSARMHLNSRRDSGEMTANLRRGVEARVMERFAPAHVIVNAEGDVLHYSSRTGKYLEAAAGLPNRQLMAMARRGLRLDLRAAMREAAETRRSVTREHISIEIEDRIQLVDLTVEPFGDNDSDPLFLAVFTDVGQPFTSFEAAARRAGHDGDHSFERLETELRDTRERLQATIEEYETAVEELKSSNEELQSINEELQSTNEELETSKEELQSVNEELQTVNSELNAKVDEVDRANNDLRNLFESTQVATVFLDRDLVIRTFTPAVTHIFNLISSDRGRPLTDIASNLDSGDLKREVQTVFEQGQVIERRVKRADGRAHYLMRILPYRRVNTIIEGVLVTFFDISRIVEAEAHQRTLVEELNHRVRNMLTIVNAIASQTNARTDSKEAFVESFIGRIRAMGTAYSLVSRENWANVSLHDVVVSHLQPYQTEKKDCVVIAGPRVLATPNAAVALGMVVHELATNAMKYGALSSPIGHVHIDWLVTNDSVPTLKLRWRESGGPSVEKPKRKGFGRELVERELGSALDASVEFEFAETGLEVVMLIPLHPTRIFLPSTENTLGSQQTT